jgi:hypothetical protein
MYIRELKIPAGLVRNLGDLTGSVNPPWGHYGSAERRTQPEGITTKAYRHLVRSQIDP